MPAWTTAVLVHGLYMPGYDMALLAWRLRRAGVATRIFRYPSLTVPARENAARLARWLEAVPGERLELVCHSLGGLVARHLVDLAPDLRPGRIVTLGTPHAGSAAAERLSRSRAGRLLLGRAGPGALLGGVPPWDGARELGSIAGTLRLGFGRLVPGVPAPGDGTVAVAETRLPGMRDHVTVPASHSGLLVSRAAADQTIAFLREGRFRHA